MNLSVIYAVLFYFDANLIFIEHFCVVYSTYKEVIGNLTKYIINIYELQLQTDIDISVTLDDYDYCW